MEINFKQVFFTRVK